MYFNIEKKLFKPFIHQSLNPLTVCILPEVCWGHIQKISPGSSDDVESPLAFN